jgi:tetratricopeptide (TPR) repeat protein
MLGISFHLVGDQGSAQKHCQAALIQPQIARHDVLGRVGYDYRIRTLVALTRTLWLRGYADQAMELAGRILEEAQKLGHPVSLGFALIYVGSVLVWVGHLQDASRIIDGLFEHAERHGLAPYHALGLGLRAELALKSGDITGAIELQRTCLKALDADRYHILATVFRGDLAEGLAMSGNYEEALSTVDEALRPDVASQLGAASRHSFHTPELLRIRARILSLQPHPKTSEVEECLLRALDIARGQTALAWELRAATDLARLWCDAHRYEEARELLAGVYDRFTEGFDTPDLTTARQLLSDLHGRCKS